MTGFVYFIRALDSGRIKIGFTMGNPWDRLDALQTGNHDPLRVHATVRGTQRKEKALHDKFHSLRERGEWFVPSTELVAYMDGIRDADPSCMHREHLDRVVAKWRGVEARRSVPQTSDPAPLQPTQAELDEQALTNRRGAISLLRSIGIDVPNDGANPVREPTEAEISVMERARPGFIDIAGPFMESMSCSLTAMGLATSWDYGRRPVLSLTSKGLAWLNAYYSRTKTGSDR